MASKLPLKVSDLIKRYGWTILPYLSGLSPNQLAEAQVLFVDSGDSEALDADDGEHGHSFQYPLATIDYAVGLCTASEGAIIFAAPGHAETQAASGTLVTCDVASVTIIGVGKGAQRPTLTLTHTGAIAFTITAASVTIENILVYNNVDGTTKAMSISGADCTLKDVELRDAAADKEMKIGILTAIGADRLKIDGLKHTGFLDGNLCTESIRLDELTDVEITNSIFFGVFSTAAVNIYDAACVNVKVKNCYFRNGTQALTKDVVDTATGSTWTVEKCFDAVGSYGISGGDGASIAADDVSAVAAAVATAQSDLDIITGASGVNLLTATQASIDAIETDTETTIPGLIGTAQADLDIITGASGVNLLTATQASIDAIETDTGTTLPAELAKIKDQAVGSSTTYFVSSDASDDTGNGLSWATAKKTIAAAVALASNYSTIYIRGTAAFAESVVVPSTITGLRLVGVGDGKINPNWDSAAADESALTIRGLNCEVRNILFAGSTKTVSMIVVDASGSYAGHGSVIENCYFHGGGDSLSAVFYYGGSLQNKLIGNHITGFGASNTGFQAAVWGGSYVNSANDFEIRGNWFSENTDHLILQACNCLVVDNSFQHTGDVTSATVMLNLVDAGEDSGCNIVRGNCFGDAAAGLTNANGYYGNANDQWCGNWCTDGINTSNGTT